jgi:D-amino-acid dehydrogenase
MKSAIILGAGIVGVSSALHLQKRGWSVVLIDRNAPGQETSYGNAGIIQSEAVRPYAMPRDLWNLARIAFGQTNDVRYRLISLPRQARSLLQYWWNSEPARHREISAVWARLISVASQEHEVFIQQSNADNMVRRTGYKTIYRGFPELELAITAAEDDRRQYGVDFTALDNDELIKAEPSLRGRLAGAIHWHQPWTVSDPGGLVSLYAQRFEKLGGTFMRGDASTLVATAVGWALRTCDGPIDAANVVIALGPWSPGLLKKFGYRIRLVRKRGYHMHYRGGAPLNVPVLDVSGGYVMAPMAKGLRVTTGAEITAEDAPPTPMQLERAETVARELIDLGMRVESEPWFGTRPCTTDMLPVIGRAPHHRGMWMNFGHGHQGFTLGPVTGRLLAELMNSEKPTFDELPFCVERF